MGTAKRLVESFSGLRKGVNEMSLKFVVVREFDTGFMDCRGIYDNCHEAYGRAYGELCNEAAQYPTKK